MRELLRRLALAAGVAAGIWLAAWSPDALFRVEAIDFEARYKAEYAPRKGPLLPGAMSAAREFLRRNTNPGTLENYRAREVEHRLLERIDDTKDWFLEAERAGGVWLTVDDPRIAAYFDQLKQIRAVWLVSYLPSGLSPNHYLEIRWETTPRGSKAPRSLVYPFRGLGFAWIAAAVLLYLLLPGRAPRPDEAHSDPAMLGILDGVSIVMFAIIFYFPLYLADSAAEARDEIVGAVGFFWAIAALFLLRLLKNATAAARRVSADREALRVTSILGVRVIPFSQLTRVEPLVRKESTTGVRLHLSQSSPFDLDWSQLNNVEPVRSALEPLVARAARFSP
ncbi:MAG: hypothetical protein KJZ79_21905 [Bryobacteraceae bacterium]|nr:hypothetical protein [Bryobacteraceae bacterium]